MTQADKNKLMHAVMATSFSMLDTALYLDTHPECEHGLDFYQQARRNFESARREYENNVGPLSVDRVDSDDIWAWTQSPWPWEMEG